MYVDIFNTYWSVWRAVMSSDFKIFILLVLVAVYVLLTSYKIGVTGGL